MGKKPQISVNVPDDVQKWVLEVQVDKRCSKTQIGLAAFLLFALEKDQACETMLSLARQIDQALLTWDEALSYGKAGSRRTVRFMELSDLASQRLLERARAARKVEEAARIQSDSRRRRPKGA